MKNDSGRLLPAILFGIVAVGTVWTFLWDLCKKKGTLLDLLCAAVSTLNFLVVLRRYREEESAAGMVETAL